MQVADQTDHITHAVLGGQANISFGISDDPAFFQILSSALYKNPELAMVRETICNAWDAHIDSGRTDRPLTITIDDEKLVIRDYGKGIPKAMIGPIYGVYGASTKKNDGRQTGGFGLGCKSPFAYTDHFEVISYCEGEKTIYNMSKSSAEKMGKPSIVPIASFPTEESGIQVTIPVKQEHGAKRTLQDHINRVIYNGDILATVNGHQPSTIMLNQAEHGFVLLTSNNPWRHHFQESTIFVRYGNVIYPVEFHQEIDGLYRKANAMAKKFSCRLVMQASADSISITPSRESLTMSDLTISTLKELLQNFLGAVLRNFGIQAKQKQILIDGVKAAASNEDVSLFDKLYMSEWRIPGVANTIDAEALYTSDQIALMCTMVGYSDTLQKVSQWLPYVTLYLREMSIQGLVDRGLVQSWLSTAHKTAKDMRSPYMYRYYHGRSDYPEIRLATKWWQKRIVLPLMEKLNKLGLNADKSLYYFGDNVHGMRTYRSNRIPTAVGKLATRNHTRNLISMIKPSLVVCHNHETMQMRLRGNTKPAGTALHLGEYFVLEIPRTKGSAEQVMELLKGLQGVDVFDYTGRTASEQQEYERRAAAAALKRSAAEKTGSAVVKKTGTGLVCFAELLPKGANHIDTQILSNSNPARIKNPEYIVKVSTAMESRRVADRMDQSMAAAVAKLWGSEGAVTNNSGVYDRNREKGVKSVEEYVVKKLADEIISRPELLQHLKFEVSKANAYLHQNCSSYSGANHLTKVYAAMIRYPELHQLVPGYVPLSYEDQLRMIVWEQARSTYPWNRLTEVVAAIETWNNVSLCKEATDVLDKLAGSKHASLLDTDEMKHFLEAHHGVPAVMQKLAAIINLIIN